MIFMTVLLVMVNIAILSVLNDIKDLLSKDGELDEQNNITR